VKADTGHRRGLLHAEVDRLRGKIVRWGAGVLGQGSGAAPAEHRITWLQSLHAPADRLHPAGDVHPADPVAWPAQPERQAHDGRHTGHDEVIAGVDSGRVHAHEHVVIADHRLVNLRVLEHVGAAVAAMNDGHHRGCRGRAGKSGCAGVLVDQAQC
jgi:hypothetical protein